MKYTDDGHEVEGYDHYEEWGWKSGWNLDYRDSDWYPGPDDRVWVSARGEFSDGFDHAANCRFLGYPGDYDYAGYIYPKPTLPWQEEITGGRSEL